MEPKYKVNSIIYVKKTSPDNIKVGDSITFHLSEDLIATHEVYKIDKTKKLFYTRGINNKDENGNILNDANPVKYENLIGKPIFTIAYIGMFSRTILKKPIRYYIIGIIIISLVMEFILERKKD